MPKAPRQTLDEYRPLPERHFSWSREWGDLSRSRQVALCVWALVVCPLLGTVCGVWGASATSHQGRGIAVLFVLPLVLVAVATGLARLQSYALIALAIGSVLVSGALFLGLLMWAGAHGALS
jgi:ABC-type spermidine/putrescine transport system permease subunit II